MSLLNQVTNALQKVPLPEKLQDGFLMVSKKDPTALWVPETSVIVGRSAAAWERGGFMEFQERGPEEVAVAVLWIHGVQWMIKLFNKLIAPIAPEKASALNKLIDKAKPGFLKNIRADFLDIAWNPFGKTNHVDLTAAERFTKGATEMRKLWYGKGLRWLFSVGTIMGSVALLIPWLNQAKTNWLLKRQKAKGQPQVPAQPIQQGQAAGQAATALPAMNAANWAVNPTESAGWHNPYVARSAYPPVYPGFAPPMQAPRFGFMGKLAQALGHGVEQTHYGSVLAIDTGITGGRAVVAGRRSPFEAIEIVFRDAVSLYFYILFAPHVVAGLGKLLDPALHTSLELEPKVAKQLKALLEKRISAIAKDGNVPVEEIRKALFGLNADEKVLEKAGGALRGEMRSAGLKHFQALLRQEGSAYLGEAGEKSVALVNEYLSTQFGAKTTLSPERLRQLAEAVAKGKGGFQTLSAAERTNLSTAVKQAFRHTAGLQMELTARGVESLPGMREFLNTLPAAERQEAIERVMAAARQDGLDQLASMFRRSVNLLGEALPDQALVNTLEERAKLLEVLVHKADTLDDGLKRQLVEAMETLGKQAATLSPEKSALLKTYLPEMKALLAGKNGRLFSLLLNAQDEALTWKVNGVLRGGLAHDNSFLRQALSIAGQLKDDPRKYMSSETFSSMRKQINGYARSLAENLETSATAQANGKRILAGAGDLLEGLWKRSSVAHYGAKSLGMIGAMFFLGYAIPKWQYALTKKLTGKDTHPGIASAAQAHGMGAQDTNGKNPPLPAIDNSGYLPLDRNNFSAFKLRPSA